jgi:hypothetical protein
MKLNFHHGLKNGQQFHTHFLITSREAWELLPESKNPFWQMLTHEDEVFAVSVDVTVETAPAVTPQSQSRVYIPSLN